MRIKKNTLKFVTKNTLKPSNRRAPKNTVGYKLGPGGRDLCLIDKWAGFGYSVYNRTRLVMNSQATQAAALC